MNAGPTRARTGCRADAPSAWGVGGRRHRDGHRGHARKLDRRGIRRRGGQVLGCGGGAFGFGRHSGGLARLLGSQREDGHAFIVAQPAGAGRASDEQVRALEVFCKVDLDGVQVGDVDRLNQHLVLLDRQLDAALEVVLVFDTLQLA